MAAFSSFLRRFTSSFHTFLNLKNYSKQINYGIKRYSEVIKPRKSVCYEYVPCIKGTLSDKKDRRESDEKTPPHLKLSLLGLGFLAAVIAVVYPAKITAGIDDEVAKDGAISGRNRTERGSKGKYVCKTTTGNNDKKLQQMNLSLKLKVKRKLEPKDINTKEVKVTSKKITRNQEVSLMTSCI